MQELEETAHWLELLEGARLCLVNQLEPLPNEADQLMAIFVTIVRLAFFSNRLMSRCRSVGAGG
jgi:hypothetical protein